MSIEGEVRSELEKLTKHYWECGKEGLVDAGKNTPIDTALSAILKLTNQSELLPKIDGNYQCEHVKEKVVRSSCVWCNLTVAEKIIDRLKGELTNLKPELDLKNILAQAWYCADYDEVGNKQHKKMDEFLDDQKDFIEAISRRQDLKPLSVEEVEKIIEKTRWSRAKNIISGQEKVSYAEFPRQLAVIICSHFSKPVIKYPEKKVCKYYSFPGHGSYCDCGADFINKTIDKMKKLNGEGV